MGDFSYRDDYEGHQPDTSPAFPDMVTPEVLTLPPLLDSDMFTDEQLEYLAAWWQEARKETVCTLLGWLLRSHLKIRLVILDKMLNHDDIPWGETAAAYSVSKRELYKVKHEVEQELAKTSPSAASLLFMRKHRR